MQILCINNDRAGFADYIEVAEGTTVLQLFEQQIRHGKPSDYLIRVNRQPVASDQQLQPGDRVSLTPVKIERARLHPLVAFISMLGGLNAIGLWGLFLGPIVAGFFYSLLKILHQRLEGNEIVAANGDVIRTEVASTATDSDRQQEKAQVQ